MKTTLTPPENPSPLPKHKRENASGVCYMEEFPAYFGQDDVDD